MRVTLFRAAAGAAMLLGCIVSPVACALPPDVAEAFERCVGCHGENGISTEPDVPHLGGQLRSYLADAIDALQSGHRPSSSPRHIPANLTSAQLSALAEFFSTQNAPRDKELADPSKVIAGRGVYLDRCEACHPDNGRETDNRGLGAPFLAGQRLDYLRAQMQDFVSGKRRFPLIMMHHAFEGLADPALEAVAHFFAAQEAQKSPPDAQPETLEAPRRSRRSVNRP